MSEVLKDMLAVIAPALRQLGYKGSGQNYRLKSEQAISVVNFQKSSGGERFYVNVGVQPLFVQTAGDSTPQPKTIKEYDCIFTTRLAPPKDHKFGWPYSTALSENLVNRFTILFNDWVTPLMTIPGPITEARVDDFRADTIHPLLGAHHPRNLEHFARICVAMDNHEAAAEFVRVALKIASPSAKGLIRRLKKFLTEIGS